MILDGLKAKLIPMNLGTHDTAVEELLVGICLLRIPKLAEFNALNSKLTTREFINQINEKQEIIDELMSGHAHLLARRHADGLLAYFQTPEDTLTFGLAASSSGLNDSLATHNQWRHLVVGIGYAKLKFSPKHRQFFGFEQDLLMDISTNLLESTRPTRFLTERAKEALIEPRESDLNRRMLVLGGRKVNYYCHLH